MFYSRQTYTDFLIGLFFIVGFSAFAGMVFTVLAARYGLIDISPIQ